MEILISLEGLRVLVGTGRGRALDDTEGSRGLLRVEETVGVRTRLGRHPEVGQHEYSPDTEEGD